MILAYRTASGPDAFGPNLTRPSRSYPGRFCTMWSGPSFEERSRIRCGKSDPAYMVRPDSGCMPGVMATTLATLGNAQISILLLCFLYLFVERMTRMYE